MKLKFLAAALAAIAASTSAHATLLGTGDYSLVLVVGDNNGQTYARNLGGINEFLAADSANEVFSAPTGSIFSSTINGLTSLNQEFFGIVAVDTTNNVEYSTLPSTTWGTTLGQGLIGALDNIALNTQPGNSWAELDASYKNATTGEYTGSPTTNDLTNAQEILSLVSHSQLGDYQAEGLSGQPFTEFSTTGGRAAITATTLNGTFSIDTAGDVTWTAGSVSSVPLPAAAWLLGSGLLGLVGIGRRRSQTRA